jgi:hypothetical protein
MKRALFLLLCVLSCVACSSLAPGSAIDIFNADLRTAYDHYDQAMAAQRPTLRFASGKTVHDCRGYLDQRPASAIDEAVNNRILAQEYLVCDSLELLHRAGPGSAAGYRPESYGKELLYRLDLRSFPSSLRPMIDDNHFVLSELPGTQAHVEPHTVTVETADWEYRFEVVADVDAAGGGHDWLIWFSDVARNGNYRGYAALVVRNPAATGPLTAHAMP